MGLLGKLLETAIDVVTIPLDVVGDVANVLEGSDPRHLSNKARELGKDIGEAIEDTVDGDLGFRDRRDY